MKVLFIFCVFLNILKAYCSLYNTRVEKIAALILAASNENNKIKRKEDNSEIKVNISDIGNEEELASIMDIIPSLRRIKNKYNKEIKETKDNNRKKKYILEEQMKIKLDWKFQRLVKLSLDVYEKYFGIDKNPIIDYD
eukprot:jgi/Orpsp1_1/1189609/evm.model.d7180000073219.1